jgi:hypothetical protein
MIRFLLLVLAIPAWSQALELAGGGGVTRLSNAGLGKVDPTSIQDDYSLKGGYRIVMRMTLNSGDFTAHETGYAYNRTQLVQNGGGGGAASQTGMAVHQGFYNYLVYPTREGSRIRPFAAGGVHFANFVPPGASATNGGGSTKFGVNYGGGLKIRLSEKFLLRFDARQYINPKPFGLNDAGGWIRMNEFSTALAFVL